MTDPIRTAIAEALTRVQNYPERVGYHVLGEDMTKLIDKVTEAVEATLKPEWGFNSPQTGLVFATRNEMLVEIMHAAKPEETVLKRLAPDWTEA